MADVVINERALQAEVDEVRSRITDTKDLYKWVCALLFFRYGVTPTTNRLYQLVRKGSMGTVTTALSTFWQDLREKSRVQIDHPGIPDSLKSAAGDLVQTLWEKANVEAKAQFEAATAEANAKVTTAEGTIRETEATIRAMQLELGVLTKRDETAVREKTALASTLEDERRTHSAISASLEAARFETASLRQDLADSRRDFAIELDKARAAIVMAEERLVAAERRALLEIDRERTLKSEAEKETARLRVSLAANDEKFNTRAQAAAAEMGQLRGKLQSTEADLAKREAELAGIRKAMSALESTVARRDGEVVAARTHAVQMENTLRAYAQFAEHGHAAVHMALQVYANIAAQWKLSDTEKLQLLRASSAEQLAAWTVGDEPIPSEVNERVIATISIHRYLHSIFSDATTADNWLRQKNSAQPFGNRRAIDLMLDDLEGLNVVRQHLAARAAGN